ncbi:MAG: lipid-A-disaccharide synthase N-terminal domain-containing protein [Planctomycetota bacterium]
MLNVSSPAGFAWVLLGLLGQVLFTGRMLVQWLVSERSGRSVVPPAFWWMSLVGATMLLVYFVWRKEPIGVLGQATGWFIYVRNLWMIHRPGGPAVAAQPPGAAESAVGP